MTGIIPNGACVEGQTHCLNETRGHNWDSTNILQQKREENFLKYVAIGSIEISSHRRPHCTICSLGLHRCCWSVIDLFSISTGWLLLFIYFHLHTGYQIFKN